MLSIHLPKETESRLAIAAQANGQTADEFARDVLVLYAATSPLCPEWLTLAITEGEQSAQSGTLATYDDFRLRMSSALQQQGQSSAA